MNADPARVAITGNTGELFPASITPDPTGADAPVTRAKTQAKTQAETQAKTQGVKTQGLTELLRHPGLWRSSEGADAGYDAIATGYPELDAVLPGGGWPVGGLTEVVVERQGLGEVELVMPALSALSIQGRSIAWIAPPYVPYAPALEQNGMELPYMLWLRDTGFEDSLWAAEQALRSGACGAVLLWLPPEHAARMNPRTLRRLQLAAEQGETMGLLFWRRAVASSPAVLRLRAGLVAPEPAEQTQQRVSRSQSKYADSGSSWHAQTGQKPPARYTGRVWSKSVARCLSVEILKCRGFGANKMVDIPLA